MCEFWFIRSEDLTEISEWSKADPFHNVDWPGWWENGTLVSFRLVDKGKSIVYVRLDDEDGYVRIHTQFAPETVVSKRMLVHNMIGCMRSLILDYTVEHPMKGMIFNSVSPLLIAFMNKKFGFKSVGNDDYRLDFEVK